MSKRLSRLLAGIVGVLTVPQRPWRRANTRLLVANALLPRHEVQTPHGTLVFVTTHPEALQFPRDLLRREPETIAWIDGFGTPCTFWDVGANVGSYALYAARRPEISVLAFEPSPASYAALCRNIEATGVGDRLQAFCIALGSDTRLGRLAMSATHAGNSFNSFESPAAAARAASGGAFRQAAVGFSIDEFRLRFALAAPNYVKIDVDGSEPEILAGAAGTLAEPALRSLLVELDAGESERNACIVACLQQAGFVAAQRGAAQHGGSVNVIFDRAEAQ